MKKVLLYIVLFSGCLLGLNSCELFGLEYAYSYDQKHGADFGKISTDAMTWIEQQSKGEFTLQYQAILRAGMDSVYRQSTYTFFLMKDAGWDDYLSSYHYPSIDAVPARVLRTYLRKSIVPGAYVSDDIVNPIYVQTLDSTVTMRIYKTVNAATSSQNLNSLRAGWTNPNGKINQKSCITSNLRCANGVMHVMSGRFTTMD